MRSLVLLLVAACAAAPREASAPAPLAGVDGSADQADHACNVVLRDLAREGDGLTGYVTSGGSWVFQGTVEVSQAAAAEGLAPSVLYRADGDATWHEAQATASSQAATPGYAAFDVTLDQGMPGPATADPRLEVVPLLHLSGGGRLFDHNRNPGALDNYVLTAPDLAVWRDDMVCTPPSGPQAATLVFGADWSVQRQGVLAPGGQVTLAYATSRLGQCADEQAGHLRWDITAHVAFAPGGEQRDVSVVTGGATIPVPADARRLTVYFEATSADGCHAYDSAYGANYTFPAMTAPAWLGNADNLLTRDEGGDICGGTAASSGVTFDTWARQRAVITNLCFEVYQPGVTDTEGDPWQALDANVYWRAAGATAWNVVPVDFDRRVGNNARYALSWRGIDPFRPYHCPGMPTTMTSDGQYVQAQLEYYIDVNGAELRPEPGAAFAATFTDYPNDPWRAANCP